MGSLLAKNALISTTLSLVALIATGCGATSNEYKQFSKYGSNYADAIDELLAESSETYVTASSWRLYRNDTQNAGDDQSTYRSTRDNEKQWLNFIERMRTHTTLLKRYFESLESLAALNEEESDDNPAAEIFEQIYAISAQIKGDKIIANDSFKTALEPFTKIVIGEKITGALRRELQTRKEAIAKELILQELALKLISNQARSDLKDTQASMDWEYGEAPYVSETPINNPESWIIQRKKISKLTSTSESLKKAASTAEEFRESFQLILEGKFTLPRANSLINSINTLLDAATALKKADAKDTTDAQTINN